MTDTPAARPPRPRTIEVSAGLFALAAVAALAAAGSLFGISGWLTDNIKASAAKSKTAVPNDLPGYVHQVAVYQTIVAAILAVLLGVIAWMALDGRSFARWAALGLYVLSTLTGTLVGITAVLSVGASEPLVFKVPSFIAGAAFLAGVIAINLRTSTEWLSWGRPAARGTFAPRPPQDRPAGGLFGSRPAAGRGGGLFGSRPAAGRGGGLFGRPVARPDTVDVEPVEVRTRPSEDAAPRRPRPAPKAKSGGKSAAKSRRS